MAFTFFVCQSAFHETLYLTDEIFEFFPSSSSYSSSSCSSLFHCKRGWCEMCVSSYKLIWNRKKWLAPNVDTTQNNQGKMKKMKEPERIRKKIIRETGM